MGVHFAWANIAIVFASIAVMAALYIFFAHMKLGRAVPQPVRIPPVPRSWACQCPLSDVHLGHGLGSGRDSRNSSSHQS